MNDESVAIVIERLDALAAKLGVAADHFWPLFVRQQYLDALVPFSLNILSLLALLFYGRYLKHHWEPDDGFSIVYNDLEVPAILCFTFLSIVFLASFISSLEAIFVMLNPEYHALMKLIHG